MRLRSPLGRLLARRSNRPPKRSRRLQLANLEDRVVPSGNWAELDDDAPNDSNSMLLLSNGTVMVNSEGNNAGNDWSLLTPDASGSYVHGSWSDIANMAQTRLFFGSAVLRDGRVMVLGGEYTDGDNNADEGNQGEIYDPVANTWSGIANFPQTQFGDGSLMVLPDGRVLAGDLNNSTTQIYDPATDTWTAAGALRGGDTSSEESWVKLPDGSILTYAIQGSQRQRGQRYLPGTDQWVDAASVPVQLDWNGGQNIVPELGPGLLMYNGKVLYVGAGGTGIADHTAVYTPPSTLLGTGSWAAGPDIPSGLGAFDGPGAVLPNGHVIFAASNQFNGPSTIFEYDPTPAPGFPNGTISTLDNTNGPDLSMPAFQIRMLALPSGQVLVSNGTDDLFVFTPDGGPDDAWRPVITGVSDNHDGTFTLSGLQLNGLTEGAYYGDDAQMATNFPLIRFTQGSNVYYGRTFNWSSTGVATGSTPETAQFTLPFGTLNDFDSITVVANGVPSAPTQAPLALDNTMQNVVFRVNPFDSNEVQVLVAGVVVRTYANNSDSPIPVIGNADNNSVTMDETWGVVNTPIMFDGGGDASAPGDRMNVIGSDGNDTLNLSPASATSASMTFNGSRPYSFTNIRKFSFDGMAGNDEMAVDSGASLLGLPDGVAYDGGTGSDHLTLKQSGGTARTSDAYSVGANPGEGTSTITGGGVVQVVSFENLAPVLDTVPAASLVVNASPADNAISYTQGSVPANGKVTIDNFESVEFSNKTSLVLNGLAGTDVISLNNSGTPTGLTGIIANGGDPTSGDSLIVNGTAATVSVNTAARTVTGAGPVGISYDGAIEALTVNAGPSTTLAVSGSAGYAYTPGAATNAGTVQADSLPIAFTGIGAGENLTLSGSSAVINGTAGNDTFAVSGSAGTITPAGRATIGGSAVAAATIDGQDGADTVIAAGNGGGVTAALGAAPATLSGGGLGTIRVPNVEVVNLSNGAGGITVNGTAGPDAFVVTPTGANTASVQVGGAPPVLNTTNTGPLTVADGFAGDGDTLTVNGTSAGETIGVSPSAVTVGALKAIGYAAANVEALAVNGNAGSDTFNVTTGAVPVFIDGGDPIGVLPGDLLNVQSGGNPVTFTPGPLSDQGGFVVGADQPLSFAHIESLSVTGGGGVVLNGTNGNDVFTVIARDASTHAGADGVRDFTTSLNAGPEFLFLNVPSLTFHALSGDDTLVLRTPAPNHADWNVNVSVDGGVPSASDRLTVETPGTNTVVYTPASPNSGSLVIKGAVNDTPVAINDIEQLVYDGMSGNDTFTIAGTAGPNTFYVTPGTNPDAGTLAMDTTLPVSFQNLGLTGRVNIAGNGGANTLVYSGTGANDLFTIDASGGGGLITLNNRVPVYTTGVATLRAEGFAGDDTFTLVPAISASPFSTLNLNGGDQASATGDQTNLKGTTAADSIGVSGQVVTLGGVTVASSGVENINLDSGGGVPPDLLTYTGVPGVTEAISLAGSAVKGAGVLSVPGVTQVTFTNTETFMVNGQPADTDTLTVVGTNAVDRININLAAAGTAADPVLKLLNAAGTILELTLLNYTGFNILNVNALDGNDVVNVFTAATIPGGLTGRNVFVDGGLPTGKNKGTDTLNVYYLGKRPHIVHSATTQNPDDGLNTLDYGTAFYSVQYASMELVNILKQ